MFGGRCSTPVALEHFRFRTLLRLPRRKNTVEQIVQAIKYLSVLIVYSGQTEAGRHQKITIANDFKAKFY